MWKQAIVYTWLVVFAAFVLWGNFSGKSQFSPSSMPFEPLVNWIVLGGFVLLMLSSFYILFGKAFRG